VTPAAKAMVKSAGASSMSIFLRSQAHTLQSTAGVSGYTLGA
jgi:hypothetical protein